MSVNILKMLSCLVHIINIARQALIKGYSTSQHYDPFKPDDHTPDVNATLRDKVSLVWAIAVKVTM